MHFDLRKKLNFAMLRTVFFDVFWRCAKIVAQDYRPSPDTGIRTKPFLHVGRPHVLPPVCGPPSITVPHFWRRVSSLRYAKKLLLDSEEFESRPFVRVTRHTSTICPSPIRPMPGASWKTTKIRSTPCIAWGKKNPSLTDLWQPFFTRLI